MDFPKEEQLCVGLQPLADKRWWWCVKYPHGVICKSGESDTLNDAATTAAVVLEVLEAYSKRT